MKIRRMKTGAAGVLLAAAATLSAACDGDGFPLGIVSADTDGGAQIAAIEISPDTIRIQRIGEAVQLSATPLDAAGVVVEGADIRWSSTDITIATVSAAGVVIARGPGRAQIIAASGGVEARVFVSVVVTGPPIGAP